MSLPLERRIGTRIVIIGNSGSGKTTMASGLAAEHRIVHLDLDQYAWGAPAERQPMSESARMIEDFLSREEDWIIEGCYSDLLETVLPHATEVRFLNPGIEKCLANCAARPWEPSKYASEADQDDKLVFLLDWVRQYEVRGDEYSLSAHRSLFESFGGAKQEYGPGDAESL